MGSDLPRLPELSKEAEASQSYERFVERVKLQAPNIRDDEARFVASMLRKQFVDAVNDQLRLYQREGNGLTLWRALRLCHEQGEPIPEPLIRKFAKWANALEAVNDAKGAARALELSGDAGAYKGRRSLNAAEKLLRLATEVHLFKSAYPSVSNTQAFDTVARNSRGRIKSSQAKDAYYAWRRGSGQRIRRGQVPDTAIEDALMRIVKLGE